MIPGGGMTTDGLIIATTVVVVALILVQSIGFTIGLVKMHRDFMATLDRMEKYRLVERK